MTLKTSIKLIFLVGLVLLAAASQFTSTKNTLSLLIGHFSFSFNMLLITWLAQWATQSMAGEGKVQRRPALVLVLGGLKFSALIGVLFASIIWYKLPPLFIAGGALIGLVTFLWVFVVRYLKDMASAGQ